MMILICIVVSIITSVIVTIIVGNQIVTIGMDKVDDYWNKKFQQSFDEMMDTIQKAQKKR